MKRELKVGGVGNFVCFCFRKPYLKQNIPVDALTRSLLDAGSIPAASMVVMVGFFGKTVVIIGKHLIDE